MLLHLTWSPLCALLFMHPLSAPHLVHVDTKAVHILKLLARDGLTNADSTVSLSLACVFVIVSVLLVIHSSLEIPCVIVSSSQKSQIEVVVQPVSCFIRSFGSFSAVYCEASLFNTTCLYSFSGSIV